MVSRRSSLRLAAGALALAVVLVIAYVAIWFVVCVSLVSAIDYFAAFWSKIDRRVSKRRRRAFILSRRHKPQPAPRRADADVAPTT